VFESQGAEDEDENEDDDEETETDTPTGGGTQSTCTPPRYHIKHLCSILYHCGVLDWVG